MMDLLHRLFAPENFMPHGHCYLWEPDLLALHIISDALITASYFSIPFTLVYFTRKRRDLEFNWMFVCFAVFIVACGTTHLMEIWVIWYPAYWMSGGLKAFTALASVSTAILLVRLIPDAVRLPSPSALKKANAALEMEVQERKRAENETRELNEQLEARVQERVQQIEAVNRRLEMEIAERHRAEAAQVRLAAIVQSSDDAIISKNLEGIITSWNPGAEKIFGYSATEAVGQSMLILIPPERVAEEPVILERIARGDIVEHFETTRLRKDGRRIEISAAISALRDSNGQIVGASKIARDITARKQMEAELRRSREEFRDLYDNAPIGYHEVNTEGRLVRINQAELKMLGYSADELVGQFVWKISADEEISRQAVLEKLAGAVPPVAFERRLRRKDGSIFPVLIEDKILRNEAGGIVGIRAVLQDITERKKVEEALREKELQLHAADRRLAEIVNGMTEACFALDQNWKFTFVNDRGEALLRHTRETMLGRSIWEVFHQLVGTPAEQHYRRTMAQREPVAFEVFSPLAGRWLDIRLFPTPDGLAAFLLDISERKQGEEEREKLARLIEYSHDFIGMADFEGRITFMNSGARKMIGMAPDANPQTLSFADYIPEPWQDFFWKTVIPTARTTGLWEGEMQLRHLQTGALIDVFRSTFLIRDSGGQPACFATVARDITDSKRAGEAIKQLNAELEHRVQERTVQLEEANKELEAFSYSVSHDLRTPLRAVDGFSQAVLEDFGPSLPPAGQHQLQTIRESAQRMGELIDDLLTFSRLSRQSLRKQTIDSGKLVRTILDDLQSQLLDRRIEIKFEDIPPCQGDPALLKQVWINLLSNAFKYTRKRDPAVIEIGGKADNGEVVYHVRDNGTGFDMRYAHKLFGVFQRLHRAEEYEGTGVGLAIVQRVVHRHGGRVWADAVEGVGATFYFTLNRETKS